MLKVSSDMASCGYSIRLLLFTATIQISFALQCGPDQHNLNDLKCCAKCDVGQGVVKPCNNENDTVCTPCRFGETFSDVSSHEKTCKPCRICPQYSHVAKQCDASHDTDCECDENYYWDESTRSCRQCTLCSMGYGVKRHCDKRRNTVCSACPQGSYSDDISSDPCQVCTRCNHDNQIMVRMCDALHDTVCVEAPTPKGGIETATAKPAVVLPITETPEQEKSSRPDSKSIFIPICIGALVIIVIIAIIYAIYKQVSNHRNNANNPNNKKNISYSAVNDPLQTNLTAKGGSTQQGSDSGVSVEGEPKSTTRVRDLPLHKLQSMGAMLHGCVDGNGGWTSFAKQLGYTSSVLASFETRATQAGFRPADLVISEWSNNETATVEALCQVLKAIGRDDIISGVLYGENRAIGGSTVMQNQGQMPHHVQQGYYSPQHLMAPQSGSSQMSSPINYTPQMNYMQQAPIHEQHAPPSLYVNPHHQHPQNMAPHMSAPAPYQPLLQAGQSQSYPQQGPPPQSAMPAEPQTQTENPPAYPAHQVINDPASNAPAPVYRQGPCSHSSHESGSMSPAHSQNSGKNYQPMHTKPTIQGQQIV